MTVSRVLELLPAALEWMVLFRLPALRSFGDTVIRRMFFLPPEVELSTVEFVVLTSAGRLVAAGEELVRVGGTAEPPGTASGTGDGATLAQRFARHLSLVDVDSAHCLGLGEKGPFPPVLLHLKIEAGIGQAIALLQRPPSTAFYELLPAVGVEYVGCEERDGLFAAAFRHRLPAHLEAGEMAGFSRTGHCNEFFLRQCNIDGDLEIGLVRASEDRIGAAARRAATYVRDLADRASSQTLAMTCEAPYPAEPYAYGDLVPLGFVLRALGKVHTGVREKLLAAREGGLWAYHTGRLITATDSALVLQGIDLPESVEALERFSDGSGAYYPQLWGPERTTGRMGRTDANEHWCQTDYATTCLVRALRHRARLPLRTPLSYIEEGFESRAGLYFANPYLTDWCVAEALRGDPAAEPLRQRLTGEILDSANPDGTFGQYDLALSTGFAILALAAAGYRGRRLTLAQLRLMELAQAGGGWPESRPFYSTLRLPREFRILSAFAPDGREVRPGWVVCGGELHEVSLYRDSHGLIGAAVAAMALAERSLPRLREPDFASSEPGRRRNARYSSATHAAYIGKFALRAYIHSMRQAVAS